MGAIIQGTGTEELCWDAQQLVIRLPRRVFGALWDTLVTRLSEAWQTHCFFVWTQLAMTARSSEPDAPRWRVHPLDVLSGLLFLLKVSAQHELVRLGAVIDWAQINALCAPLYSNAHGGPHAWAPAQPVALLTLMFLHGVLYETTLLCRVQENTDRLVWRSEREVCCPHGTVLQPQGHPYAGRQTFVGTACGQCEWYARCHPNGQGAPKSFTLNPAHHRRWQENREHCQSAAYKTTQRQRFVEEGRFGLAKTNYHAGKAPYRSDEMNHCAALLIAAMMDWRVLARHQVAAPRLGA